MSRRNPFLMLVLILLPCASPVSAGSTGAVGANDGASLPFEVARHLQQHGNGLGPVGGGDGDLRGDAGIDTGCAGGYASGEEGDRARRATR